MRQALRRHLGDDPVLGKVSPQGVDQHRSMSDQKVSAFMEHQHRLLLVGLHSNEAHGWTGHRLADRLGCRATIRMRS